MLCIQELCPRDHHYPWRVMVTCILLNQTHGRQVRPIMDRLWKLLPTPQALLTASADQTSELNQLLRPLGFLNRRSSTLLRMTRDYLDGKDPHHCYGIGKYASDALDLFVYGQTDVKPTDQWLEPYLQWRRDGGPRVNWG